MTISFRASLKTCFSATVVEPGVDGCEQAQCRPVELAPPASRHRNGSGAKSLIKSKSMLTEECGFRAYMASVGIEVIETYLGERIQLDNEDPSHVAVPAVHKLRTDIAEVFAKTIGTDPANNDVHYMAEAQREATRPFILAADVGMTGCNFAVAETGRFVVCTNEGNADLSANVPKLHIASAFRSKGASGSG
jgi:L-lactate dehydrogenase complex protein LldF